ncbi:hypothetical protein MPSEU_001064100 [Mayamaea pseudoterrestris]|nr:hypothetical protein MPSEU_001064100 [Mayamaea pseudoterrestris]
MTAETSTVDNYADVPSITIEESSIPYDREITLLYDALKSFNSSAAATLVNELNEMRSNGTDSREIDEFLNTLLSQGPDRTDQAFWSRSRLLTRFSKRLRMASLQRTLDITTPPPSDEDANDSNGVDAIDQLRRRRRALVSILRQLATEPDESTSTIKEKLLRGLRTPAIRVIEYKARRELQRKSFAPQAQDELRRRMGEDLETPKYDILVRAGRDGIEYRQYQPFAVCSVVSKGAAKPSDDDARPNNDKPKTVSAGSFNILAGYLFGKNQQQTPMKMTTPVLMDESGDQRKMSFVMPSDFWSSDRLTQAPQPIEGSGVSLALQEGQRRAVIMFGGYASKVETNRRKEQLMQGLADSKEWEIVPGATVTLSQYNDPFTPPWKRLNEVSIKVQSKK